MLFFTSEIKAQKNNSSIPIFKHRKDSIAYSKIPDSLREERYEFQRTHRHIIRTIYGRTPSFNILLVVDQNSQQRFYHEDLYHRQKLATAS